MISEINIFHFVVFSCMAVLLSECGLESSKKSCALSSDCGATMTCQASVCVDRLTCNGTCEGNVKCVNGVCMDCITNDDCSEAKMKCNDQYLCVYEKCDGNTTCGNHGTCDDSSGKFVCKCDDNYYGDRCDVCSVPPYFQWVCYEQDPRSCTPWDSEYDPETGKCYWCQWEIKTSCRTLVSRISIRPSNPTVALGGTQQFVATGTYSNSTTNITSEVTWASSKTDVATVNTTGMATSKAAGSTTISATSGTISGSTTLTVTAPVTLSSITVTPADQLP